MTPVPPPPTRPTPPKSRLKCTVCGDITETGKHKLMCKIGLWPFAMIPLVILCLMISRFMEYVK